MGWDRSGKHFLNVLFIYPISSCCVIKGRTKEKTNVSPPKLLFYQSQIMWWTMVGWREFIKVGVQLGERRAEKTRFWLWIHRKENSWGHTHPFQGNYRGWQEDIPIRCCPAARRWCRGPNISKRRPPADDPAAAHTGITGVRKHGSKTWPVQCSAKKNNLPLTTA